MVIVIAVVAAFRGWRRGLLGQAFELGGGLLGLVAGLFLGPIVARVFTQQPELLGAMIVLLVLFFALSLGQTVGFFVGHRFGGYARRARLGEVDQGLGSAFGIGVILIVFWLVGSLLVSGPTRTIARAFERSAILDTLNRTFPQPPDVLATVRQYLNTSGFPQVFSNFPRPIGGPVALPSGRQAQRAVDAADQSTVRIVVPACGGTQLGSGWVAAQDTVVTNAHVVAGGDEVTVQDPQNGDLSGRVVLFDPRTDIAIIRASGLAGGPLPLDTTDHDSGTPGATLGYPGDRNGRLVAHRAAVRAQFDAVGKDIYGRQDARREVYEIRSPVRQGDSGGPFVLPSGEVAGVIFAASTSDASTGYALTGGEVEDEIQEGSGRSEPTSTGGCTR
ncbi:MAG: MarP family serine protease [Actinomycetota bacterium]